MLDDISSLFTVFSIVIPVACQSVSGVRCPEEGPCRLDLQEECMMCRSLGVGVWKVGRIIPAPR